MAGQKGVVSKASKAAQSVSKIPMGFAAVQFVVQEVLITEDDKEELMQRVFTTSVPRSWVFMDEQDNSKLFVMYKKAPLKLGDYDLLLDYAKHEGQKAPKHWVLYSCNQLSTFNKYQESFKFIKDLVDTGEIVEPHLEPSNISAALHDIPPLPAVTTNANDANSPNSNVLYNQTINYHDKSNDNIADNNSDSLSSPGNHDSVTYEYSTPTTQTGQNSVEELSSSSDLSLRNAVHQNQSVSEVTLSNKDLQVLWNNTLFMFNKMNQTVLDVEMRLNKKFDKTSERLSSVEAKIINVQNKQNELHVVVTKNGGCKKNPEFFGFQEFCTKYKLPVPFKTLKDFTDFDAQFTVPESGKVLYEDLKKHLISTTDNHKKVKENCTEIFRRFFDRAVLKNYTAQRRSNKRNVNNNKDTGITEKDTSVVEKLQFSKSTKFYTCLQDAFENIYYNPIGEDGPKDPKIHEYTEPILLRDIGQVINDSKDWDGGRLERTRVSDENGPTHGSPKRPRRLSNHENTHPQNVLQTNQDANIVSVQDIIPANIVPVGE